MGCLSVASNCRSCRRYGGVLEFIQCKSYAGRNFVDSKFSLEEIKEENKVFFSLHFFPGLAKNEEGVHFKLD